MLRMQFIALSLGATCAVAGGVLAIREGLMCLMSDLMPDKTAPQQTHLTAHPPKTRPVFPATPLPEPRAIVPQFDTVARAPSLRVTRSSPVMANPTRRLLCSPVKSSGRGECR